MMKSRTGKLALCGLLAAAAVVIMLLCGMIPLSTYVCPMLVCVLCFVVHQQCGKKLAWIWYTAVSLLVLFVGSDYEASLVFFLLGYYPILKPGIDRSRFKLLWKLLLFNLSVLILCILLTVIAGLELDFQDFHGPGILLPLLLLVLGNTVFFLLDKLLTQLTRKVSTKENNG